MRVDITYRDGTQESLTVEQTDVVVFVGRLPNKHIRTIPWTAIKHIDIDLNDQPRIVTPPPVPAPKEDTPPADVPALVTP